ncbi:MAG: hypothetical protein V5A38_07060 [Halolamina sp.]|uniref:hypothetical protein n=1 Tax=Halolamina sp. TaxID=1940283 RepID=UPI002FC2897A
MNTESDAIPELPTLEPGLTLVETDTAHRVPLQSLAVDRLLLESGSAIWVGTGRHCTTDSLAEIVPDRRVLDRIDVARGFTSYQHTALIGALPAQVDEGTAVIVLPELDARYRDDDVQGGDGRTMLTRALAQLAGVARAHEIPVLCTRTQADQFADPVEAAATRIIQFCETPMGPRFVGDEFQTLVYPLEGELVQTTLAFWQDVLQARQPLHDTATVPREVVASGPN